MGRRGTHRRGRGTVRWLLGTGVLAGLLTGCSAPDPLVSESQQAGMYSCMPAPDAAAGVSQWDTPIGYSVGMYYNQSSSPLTVQTVSLVDAHNMVLHGAVVYEMVHFRNPMPFQFPWEYGAGGLRVDPRLVQQIPGAVIPAGVGPVTNVAKQQPNVYEVAVGVSARQPGAAWAAGVDVGYTVNGQAHMIRLMLGFAIGAYSPPNPNLSKGADPLCGTAGKAIEAAFADYQQAK